ncbi:MAG: hypothetical protein CMF80_07340 [Candidatus Marinimicrobia bacterium]|nr:hypothetical protein [Candidatus Neomarinimicrobiota bacterium]
MSSQKKIWRYKLDEKIFEELKYFAKLHEHNDRDDFKKAWEEWIKEHGEMIDQETRRLENLGFDGDVIKKLYTSARYYLKKSQDTKKKEKKRKEYVSLCPEFISMVDDFVEKSKEKPAMGFKTFMEKYKENDVVINQISNLFVENKYSNEEIFKKLNKTFKNRSYIYNK